MQNMFLLDSAACFDVETIKSRSQEGGGGLEVGVLAPPPNPFFLSGDEVFMSDCF